MSKCTGRMQDGVYNCFGRYDKTMCNDCIYNSESEAKEKHDRHADYRDRIDVFYKYLRGVGLPDGVTCSTPKLKPDMAFSVIWFLQEILHVLPDNIEQCDGCKELFDRCSGGFILDDQYIDNDTGKTLAKRYWGYWCDGCVPNNIDFEVK